MAARYNIIHKIKMDADQQFNTLLSVAEECLDEKSLRKLLEAKPDSFVAYDGFEPRFARPFVFNCHSTFGHQHGSTYIDRSNDSFLYAQYDTVHVAAACTLHRAFSKQ